MSTVISLPVRRSSSKATYFTRPELDQLLSLYSKHVATGEWRDYAIDQSPGLATFSIFRHAHDAPLFSVAKMPGGSQRNGPYAVFKGKEKLKQGRSLSDVLRVFEKQLRVIR